MLKLNSGEFMFLGRLTQRRLPNAPAKGKETLRIILARR